MGYYQTRKTRRKCPHCKSMIELEVEEDVVGSRIREVRGLGKTIEYEE